MQTVVKSVIVLLILLIVVVIPIILMYNGMQTANTKDSMSLYASNPDVYTTPSIGRPFSEEAYSHRLVLITEL